MAPLSHAGGRHGLPAGDLETAAQPLWLRVGGCGGAQGLDPNLTQNGTFWDVCKKAGNLKIELFPKVLVWSGQAFFLR